MGAHSVPRATTPDRGQLDRQVLRANVEYHDRIADAYERDVSTAPVFTRESQQRIQTTVQWLRARTRGGVWVDVGCGTGNVLKFAHRCFDHAVGFDVSTGMLQLARRRGLEVGVGNALNLPVASAVADVVSTFSVLHHLYDPRAVLSEVSRVLRPGGFFYSDFDPNGLWPFRRPWLYRIYHPLYRWYTKLMYRVSLSVSEQGEEIDRLQNLAEYHHSHTAGISPLGLADTLRELGFSEVGLYTSFGLLDPARLREPQPTASRTSLTVYPLFAIIARKGADPKPQA